MLTADGIKDLLGLRPLPREGGDYAETYRSDGTIPIAAPPPGDQGARSFGTAISYLLTTTTCSAMHRLPGDEVFHHDLGDAVEQLRLQPDGSGAVVRIGSDLLGGERPQTVVPGGVWQGARLAPGGRHGDALLGTTMAPGFDPRDYDTGDGDALTAAYPAWRGLILALRPPDAGLTTA